MKVLFINKYDITGGAAITAMRLSESLQHDYNVNIHFLVAIKRSNFLNVHRTRGKYVGNFIERSWNIMTSLAGYQYVFFPFSTKNILKNVSVIRPDIISLHNLHGGYFDLSLLPKLSKVSKLVWTFHDMWPFTASAAHAFGYSNWRFLESFPDERKHFPKIGLPNYRFLFNRKKTLYAKTDFTIVTPSKWMYQLVKQSPLFQDKKIFHIYNGINLDLFKPNNDKIGVRKKFNIPADARVVIFSSEKLMSSEYKGGNELINILQSLDTPNNSDIFAIVIGKDNLPITFKFIKSLHKSYIFDVEEYISYLQASDVYIYPTKADNLPNVLIEAIACGIPCVTFDVGGCAEIIKNGFSGYVIPSGDVQLFSERVIELLENPAKRIEFSLQARSYAEEHFDIHKMAKAYFELFQDLINL